MASKIFKLIYGNAERLHCSKVFKDVASHAKTVSLERTMGYPSGSGCTRPVDGQKSWTRPI
jgi:hypothetical protein